MDGLLQIADVVDLLDTGHTVLVPSQAAAGDLRRYFNLRRRALNVGAWEPPQVLSWAQWLKSLWDALTLEGLETRVLLNRVQEEFLWADLALAAGLGDLPSSTLWELARQASSGLELAANYLAESRLLSTADSPDSRSFATWYKAFETHCHTYRLLSPALLAPALAAHLHAGRLPAPSVLYLVAFNGSDSFAPAQSALLAALRSRGTVIHLCNLRDLGGKDDAVVRGSCIIPGDPQAELRWAAGWLREYFTKHSDAVAPVALVLPDPEREKPLLEPLLREFLAPELESVTQDLSSTPWHFSTGPALSSHTSIAHALYLLQWALGELSTETIGTLLLSPYFTHGDSFEARARFEMQRLRKAALLRPEMSLPAFLRFAAPPTSPKAQANGGHLQLPEWHDLQAVLGRPTRGTATYGEWTEYLRKLLRVAGWPGPRTLSAAEFQLTEAWEGTLDLLATLDLHGLRVTLPEVLIRLSSEAQRICLPDANAEAVIQVLRPSETEGRLFHATLVLRATDNVWPSPETSHPLLGWTLQKSLGMPGTSAAESHRRGLDLMRVLASHCSTVLLITAEHDASGPLRLTELAGELSFVPQSVESLSGTMPMAATLRPEWVLDDSALPSLPSHRIAGGAHVLELQANCGFRAFASLRLNAAVPETRSLGGDARESGQDLHKALEVFWNRITSQQALRALTPNQRNAAVSEAVAAALEIRKRSQPPGDLWTDAYLEVAHRRLTHLMLHWLEKELLRENFNVMQQEEKQLISVGPLELSVRPDRVDEVDGGLVFVDYKTSQELSIDHWLGERPLAPQLPLYALLAQPDEVRGLAFGRVRAGGDMGWISLESEAGLFPKKGSTTVSELAEQVALWRTELTRLAEEFAAGVANVDPKSYPKTCSYCQQRLLCRLQPATLLSAADGNAEEAGPEQEVDGAR